MRDANMTAMGEEPHGLLTPPATRKLAEYHLNRYFEMVEAQIRPRRLTIGHTIKVPSGKLGLGFL
jgi:hypothetical protein